MNKQNIETWELLRTVDDDEIRNFIASEKARLGDLLQGFNVTWSPTETEYQLELYSDADHTAINTHPWAYGTGLIIGRTPNFVDGDDTLKQVQRAGRAFYYLWKDEIKGLRRNLGNTES